MYEELQALDHIRINFNQGGLLALNITLGIIMFGVALGIKIQGFKTIFFKKPKILLVGLFSQFVALPLFTFLLVLLFHDYITTSIALGMILVSAAPGGNISNFISSLAKGSIELSVSLTAIATMGAVILTPFNFAFWGGLYIKYAERIDGNLLLRDIVIDNVQMFQSVFVLLGIPLILGMLFSWKLPVITEKIKKPIQTVSVIIFMLFVIIAFIKNYDIFILYIKWITVIVLVHNALALLTGFSIASAFGIKRKERRSITIETGIQNSGLALVLLFNPDIFPEVLPLGGMMFIAAWWGIWHMISGLGLAYFLSKIPLKRF